MKLFRCEHCGNIVEMINESGVPVVCCGENMKELVPGTVDASLEKHVPVYTVENGHVNVKIGAVEHPMIPEHYIQWIAVETQKGIHRKYLTPSEAPEACFCLDEGEDIIAVYEYCNIHGLWKA